MAESAAKKPTVFIPEPISSAGMDLLEPAASVVGPGPGAAAWSEEKSRSTLRVSDAVIVRLFRVGREDLENAPRLRVIAKHGVGVDNIDVRAAAALGVAVVHTPTANSNAVAEHTLALMMALARRIEPAFRAVKEGRFADRLQYRAVELRGKTLGVVGLGRVGRRVAEMAARGLGMEVIGYDPLVAKVQSGFPVSLEDSVEKVFEKSDFLTFHVPLTPQTRELVNERTLSLLKADCRIVNTSRGGVIDEAALVRALEENRLAGAALDVFADEPLGGDHPLCRAPNTLLTPHISSSTKEALDSMARDAARGVLDVLEGRIPEFPYRLEKGS